MKRIRSVILFFLISNASPLFSNPSGLVNAKGADVSHQGSLCEIKTNDGAILNWKSFSIEAHETTSFQLPNSKSFVLNRIVGNTQSAILGGLESNGSVLLINPNGILFGPNSRINVANMIASTFDIADEQFLNKKMSFRKSSEGKIIHQGHIEAEGYVLLAANAIEHSGTIHANAIYLATGDQVLFDPKGTQRLIVSHEFGDTPYEAAIRFEGEALSFEEIFFDSGSGSLSVDGTLHCPGGEVRLLGEEVKLCSSTHINVSSNTKGGTVLVGGDYRGENLDIPNSKRIWMAKEAQIFANADHRGDGGKVILWGEEACLFGGFISAEGGALEGNGGFIETSSPMFLDVMGQVSTKAPNGLMGTFLLDPVEVHINNVASNVNATYSSPNYTFTGSPATIATTLGINPLVTSLNSSNVVINAAGTGFAPVGSITVETTGGFTWTAPNSLTLITDPAGAVTINADINSNSNTFGGANGLIVQTGTLTFNNGAVFRANSGGVQITANQTNITSTNATTGIQVLGAGTVLINGNVSIQAGNATGIGNNANAGIDAIQSVQINGNVLVVAGTSGTAATEDADAGIESNISVLINGDATVRGGNGNQLGNADATIRGLASAPVTINGNASAFGGTCANTGATANSDGYFSARTGNLVINGNFLGQGGSSNGTTSANGGIVMQSSGGGDIFIQGNVELYGGTSSSGQAIANISSEGGDINISGNITMQGGTATGGSSRAVISARGGGDANIIGGNFISMTGGTGAGDAQAQIQSANGNGDVIISISGPLTMNAGSGTGNHSVEVQRTQNTPGLIDVTCSRIDITAGATPSGTASRGEIDNINGNIHIQTGPINIRGLYHDGVIETTNGFINIGAGPISLFGGNSNGGMARIETIGTGDISINASSVGLFAGTSGGTNTTADIVTETGNILINSLGLVNIVGGNHAQSEANIQSTTAGNITINCGELQMTGGSAATTNASITTQAGDIFIHSFSNATLSATLPTATADIQTFGSNLTLIADDSIFLNGFSILSTPPVGGNLLGIAGNDFFIDAQAQVLVNGPGELTLVCDNDFPTPFGFGPGQFVLVPGGTIRNFGGGPVRIFTVSPPQNSFVPPSPAMINNFPFNPSVGLTFIDVPPYEYWCIYYDPTAGAVPPFSGSSIGGFEFTVFYKLCPITLNTLTTPTQELFFNLNNFDTYFDEFYTQFDFNNTQVIPLFPYLSPDIQGYTFRRKLYYEKIGRNPEPELLDNMPFIADSENTILEKIAL